MFIRLVLFIFTLSFSLLAQTVTIATQNCEFLVRKKIHVKYGLPFNIVDAEPAQIAEWSQPGQRDAKFNESAKMVAQALVSLNADILVLTEIGNEQDVNELFDEVEDAGLNYAHKAIGNSKDNTTGQNVAVFSKFPISNFISPIPGRESYWQELDDPNSEKDTGVSKGLRITVNVHGREISLYAVHFSSERGGHEKDEQRIAQASIVRRNYLADLNAGKHVIVAGDLNDYRGQPAIKRIRGLDDIFGDLIQTGQVKYFPKDKLATRWTYSYQGIQNQIDHILISQSLKKECKVSGISALTVNHNNEKVSDHNAFIVKLNFK